MRLHHRWPHPRLLPERLWPEPHVWRGDGLPDMARSPHLELLGHDRAQERDDVHVLRLLRGLV